MRGSGHGRGIRLAEDREDCTRGSTARRARNPSAGATRANGRCRLREQRVKVEVMLSQLAAVVAG